MDDSDFDTRLAARLDEHARGVGPVGGVPLAAVTAAGRRRARRVWGTGAGTVLVAAAVCAGVLLQGAGGTAPVPTGPAAFGVGQTDVYSVPPQDCSYNGVLLVPHTLLPTVPVRPELTVKPLPPELADFSAVRLATALGELGEQYPESYRGVCWDSPEHTVYALRTGAGGFDAKATALAAGYPGVTLKLVERWPWERG